MRFQEISFGPVRSLLASLGLGVSGIAAIGADLALWFDENQAYKSSGGGVVTPDSILTYTAPSPKLVYGSDGVLRYANHNLQTYSSDFANAAWRKLHLTVTSAAAVAPDGTMTATLFTGTGVSASVVDNYPTNYGIGGTETYTFYAKAGTASVIRIAENVAASRVSFNLATGVATVHAGTPTPIMQPVGDGWYRCGWTIAKPGIYAFTNIAFGTAYAPSTTTDTFYIWGAQLYTGSKVTTYIPTTTAAVYSLPRDYNPTTGAALGVLVEEARTNLLTYSEQFDNAAWVRGNIAAFGSGSIANAIAAPDGTTTADKIVEAATTATHNMAQNATIVTATVYTYSVHAKAAERSWVCLEGGGGAGGFSVWFNLSTGAVGTISGTTAGNVSIVALPNGWYRCIVTDTSTSTSGTYRYFICDADNNQSYAGDGTSGLYLWGAQVEAGAFATSYIPTVASQVTRAADNISILTSAFPYSATAGTSVFAGDVLAVNLSSQRVLQTSGSGRLIYIGGNQISIFDGTTVLTPSGGIVVNTAFKAATAYGVADGMGATFNAGTVATGAFDGGMTSGTLYLGSDNAVAGFLNGHIKRIDYYAVRKTNAQLQVLST